MNLKKMRPKGFGFFWSWVCGVFCGAFRRGGSAGARTLEVVKSLSSSEIFRLTEEEIEVLDARGIGRWHAEQLEALRWEQLRALNAEQLRAVVHNPYLTDAQLDEVMGAFNHPQQVSKLGILLYALRGDPREKEKLYEMVDWMFREASDRDLMNFLVIASRNATNPQFAWILEKIPFETVKKLAEDELSNPSEEEFRRLDQRLEDRQFANSRRLTELELDIELLNAKRKAFCEGDFSPIDAGVSPWKRISRKRVGQLQSLMAKEGESEERKQRRGAALFDSMQQELDRKRMHLQCENGKVSWMIEQWDYFHFEDLQDQLRFLQGIVLPQATLLEEMGEVLMKQDLQEFSSEEKEALMRTLESWGDLTEKLEAEMLDAYRSLHQLQLDQVFIEDSIELILDKIRHESRIGRFSLEFFRRLMLFEKDVEVYHFLHSDAFEELLVKYPRFERGMKQLQAVLGLRHRIDELQKLLSCQVEQGAIRELRERVSELLSQLSGC